MQAAQWAGLFAAGGCGVCLRHALAATLDQRFEAGAIGRAMPNGGMLTVNLIGCLAIGVLAAALPAGTARTVVIVGLLGGFTTYSSFALVTVELAGAGRWLAFAWQLGLHVFGGMLMVALGAWLARALAR
ncbi:MAG: CrcB family protein [Myxococcales bacterium]|nr:CrcB family protein [Myxococcales bacterium]